MVTIGDYRHLAMVNPRMPITRGDASIHVSHVDVMMHHTMDLHELAQRKISDDEMKIGQIIAQSLVVDGATLQMGEWHTRCDWLIVS